MNEMTGRRNWMDQNDEILKKERGKKLNKQKIIPELLYGCGKNSH